MFRIVFIILVLTKITLLSGGTILEEFLKLPNKNSKSSLFKDRKYYFIPVAGYSQETGFMGGGIFSYLYKKSKTNFGTFTSNYDILALYTQENQARITFRINDYFRSTKSRIFAEVSYRDWNKDYFGKGGNTKTEDNVKYNCKYYNILTEYKKRVGGSFFTGFKIDLSRNRDYYFQDETNFKYLKGVGNYNLSGFGPVLGYDTRDSNVFPRSGFYAKSETLLYEKIFRDSYDFIYQNFEFRHYFNLENLTSRDYSVFVSRLVYTITDGNVPFSSLPGFGGTKNMRGLASGRFKDKHILYTEFEYRMRIFERVGASFFGGVGNVGGNSEMIFESDFKTILGAGFRYQLNSSGINFRFDFGYSFDEASSSNIFTGGEAF